MLVNLNEQFVWLQAQRNYSSKNYLNNFSQDI